jgi:hypothetical protein
LHAGRIGFWNKFIKGLMMAEFDETEYERDYPREILGAEVKILIDEYWHDCVLINISASGAKIYVGKKIARGMPVSIKIGSGDLNATVAWCRGDEAGVKFDHDPSEVTRLILELESRG